MLLFCNVSKTLLNWLNSLQGSHQQINLTPTSALTISRSCVMWKTYKESQNIKKLPLSALAGQGSQKIRCLQRIVTCAAVCNFWSGLAVLLVELIGKRLHINTGQCFSISPRPHTKIQLIWTKKKKKNGLKSHLG